MDHLITVTEAARSFADIIGRVYYRGEEFDIKKGNQIVAHIGPAKSRATLRMGELNAFFASCPTLSTEELNDFERDIEMIRSKAGEAENKWE